MTKTKNISKRNYKLLIGLFLGLIFSTTITYAWYNDYANEVSYDSSGDWLHSTTVQGALDELYKQKGCPVGYVCYSKKSTLSPGDYIYYAPSSSSYSIDLTKTGGTTAQSINPSELNLWRVLSINQDGTVDIISEHVSSASVTFRGLDGYKNFVGYLNVLASQYETSGVTVGSRHFGYSNQTEYITDDTYFVNPAPWTCSTGGTCSPDPDDYEPYGGGDTGYLNDYNLVNEVLGTRVATNNDGTANYYWMATRYYNYISDSYIWDGRSVTASGGNGYDSLYTWSGGSFHTLSSTYALRPIVTLSASLTYLGVGSKEYPFEIGAYLVSDTMQYVGQTITSDATIYTDPSSFVSAWSEISASMGRAFGIRHMIGEDNVISSSQVVFNRNNTWYTLYSGEEYFEENKATLRAAFPNITGESGCSDNGSYLECQDSTDLEALVRSNGNVRASSGSLSCYVAATGEAGTGYSRCSDSSRIYLYETITSASATLDSSVNFQKPSSASNGKGLMIRNGTENDMYPIYYYRGNVTNNNLIFANYCWKIVRTTETGGIKLVYNGTPTSGSCMVTTGTETQIGTNTAYYQSAYGMFTIASNWYNSNLSSYSSYIEDTIWCVDWKTSGSNGSYIFYAGKGRNDSSSTSKPRFDCQQAKDRYTVSTENGNGSLTNPIGLLTADECTFAGATDAITSTTTNSYLYTNTQYWLLTPHQKFGNNYYWFFFDGGKYLNQHYSSNFHAVRPSISLKHKTVIMSGDGSTTSPYWVN